MQVQLSAEDAVEDQCWQLTVPISLAGGDQVPPIHAVSPVYYAPAEAGDWRRGLQVLVSQLLLAVDPRVQQFIHYLTSTSFF